MLKAFLRSCAFLVLALLLVCAPELYAAVSAPYSISVPERLLLRISLCTQDMGSADAFLRELSVYMKEHPSVHIRVNRVAESELFSLSAPQPDLLIFSPSIQYVPSRFIAFEPSQSPVILFSPIGCTPLLCGVLDNGTNSEPALELLSHLAFSGLSAASSSPPI